MGLSHSKWTLLSHQAAGLLKNHVGFLSLVSELCLFNVPYRSQPCTFFELSEVVFRAAFCCPSCSLPIHLKCLVTWINQSCVARPEPVQLMRCLPKSLKFANPGPVQWASLNNTMDEVAIQMVSPVIWSDTLLAMPSSSVSLIESNSWSCFIAASWIKW